MWRGWIRLGQPPDRFWRITPRAFFLIRDSLIAAKEDDLRRGRVLNQELARLISFAFHSPSEMPDFVSGENPEETEMPEQVAMAMLESYFLSASRKS